MYFFKVVVVCLSRPKLKQTFEKCFEIAGIVKDDT